MSFWRNLALRWGGLLLLALLLLAAFGGFAAAQSAAKAEPPRSFQLELPQLGAKRYASGVVRIPEPQGLTRLAFSIPAKAVHKVFPKINTLGAATVQTCTAFKSEVRCELDLSLHEGRHYALKEADNIIELEVQLKAGERATYTRWVIAPPNDPGSWLARREAALGTSGASLDERGLEILEELPDGTLKPLEQGLTSAPKIHLRARFTKWEESPGLAIRWRNEDGDVRHYAAAAQEVATAPGNAASEAQPGEAGRGMEPLEGGPGSTVRELRAEVELARGENLLEVEVRHGTTPLLTHNYTLLRRSPSEPSAVAGEKWALVIGISDYQAERLDLRFADRDAQAVRNLLVDRGGFSPDRVRLLTNAEATIQAIRSALFTWLGNSREDDLVLIYLAGHGVQDLVDPSRYFLLAHDTAVNDLGGTALSMRELEDLMGYGLIGRQVMIVADTCHSGAVPVSGGTNLNFFNKYLEALGRKRGRLVLTSSQAHQSSIERDDVGHGVFTYTFLEALKGGADDNPKDGVVTVAELVDQLKTKVPEETRGEQHPTMSEQGFDLDMPLVHLRTSAAPPP